MITIPEHIGIIKALELAINSPRSVGNEGWMAVIEVSCDDLSEQQKSALSENLIGVFEGKQSRFLIIVSDNNEQPLLFDSLELASSQARQTGANLISRYCFSVYSTTGEVLQYSAKPTLHFMPGRMKST